MIELTLERSPVDRPPSRIRRRSIVVAVRGELDIGSEHEVEWALTSDGTQEFDQITLDLRGVSFMDGAGLHALQRVCDHHRSNGRQIRLHGVPPQVRRLFQLLGVAAVRLGDLTPASDARSVARGVAPT